MVELRMMDTIDPAIEQRIVTRERLRILSIACYIRGAVIVGFSSLFLIYVVILIGITFVPDSAWENHPKQSAASVHSTPDATASPAPATSPHWQKTSEPPPKFIFRIMAGVLGCVVLLGWIFGGLTAYAGWCIEKRRAKPLIYAMGGLNCLFIPYGTLLGLCIFVVLSSAAGRLEFQAGAGTR
jgi:hypothetical protein